MRVQHKLGGDAVPRTVRCWDRVAGGGGGVLNAVGLNRPNTHARSHADTVLRYAMVNNLSGQMCVCCPLRLMHSRRCRSVSLSCLPRPPIDLIAAPPKSGRPGVGVPPYTLSVWKLSSEECLVPRRGTVRPPAVDSRRNNMHAPSLFRRSTPLAKTGNSRAVAAAAASQRPRRDSSRHHGR